MPFQLYFKVSIFCLLAFLSACDKSEKNSEPKLKTDIILNDANINEFTITFSNHYLATLNDLTNAFEKFKETGDDFGFIKYRNQSWTPNYIEKKEHYQTIRHQNKQYLTDTVAMQLFAPFERLIFIGLELKKGLSNNDEKLINKALATIKKDQKKVKEILASALKTKTD